MVRLSHDRILLIADTRQELEPVIAQAAPAAQVTRVDSYFDAIAELSAHDYSAVVANAEPIERRPESAIRTLRELGGDCRVILFGHSGQEPLSRRMMEFGCDDYVIAPSTAAELQQILGKPLMRLAQPAYSDPEGHDPKPGDASTPASGDAQPSKLLDVPLSDLVLDALVEHPGIAADAAIKSINAIIAPDFELVYQPPGKEPPGADESRRLLTIPVRISNEATANLHLRTPANAGAVVSRNFLDRAAAAFTRLATLQDRHNRLQKLAITDQLTGIYNRRYFEHFLSTILERAKAMRFQVTLLMFDIDDFKRYNDECGHGLGDEILKETAALMRICCREHDLVARVGGDEFAVVFWEKEPPRQPKDPAKPITPGRVPQEPLQILRRFRRTISKRQFTGLGSTGRGTLTISGGLATFPWDGLTAQELIQAADRALTFGAKKSGKNSIYLVGGDEQKWSDDPPAATPDSTPPNPNS